MTLLLLEVNISTKVIKTEGTKLHLITSRAFLYFLLVATFGVFPRGSSIEVIFVLWERSSKDNVLNARFLHTIVIIKSVFLK